MKIGILTQPLHNNYGGLLQNYALQKVLQRKGIEPETIDHGSLKVEWWKEVIIKCQDYVRLLIHPSLLKDKKYQPTPKELAVISRNTRHFIDTYIVHTDPFRTGKELKEIVIAGNYDGFVVGSDQCWRPRYSGGFLKEMFLSFVDDTDSIKRVAYAASFGTDQWEYSNEMTSVCRLLANKFNCISVREESGVKLCRKHLGVEATHVLDPTMLLSKEDYYELVKQEKEPQSPGDLFYYILDPNPKKTEFIQGIAKKEQLVPFTVLPKCQAENRTKKDIKRHIEDCVYPSVTSWLRGFVDAKMVVVDSFHGAVFSIIFNKPFWIIANPDRGNARFTSLLQLFEIEDRLLQIDQLHEVNYKKEINWRRANEIKSEMTTCSLSVLNCLC